MFTSYFAPSYFGGAVVATVAPDPIADTLRSIRALLDRLEQLTAKAP